MQNPLEDLGTCRVRGEQATRRPITWVRLGVLCSPDHNLPCDILHHAGRREDGVWILSVLFFAGELARESIGLSSFRAGTIGDCEVKLTEE